MLHRLLCWIGLHDYTSVSMTITDTTAPIHVITSKTSYKRCNYCTARVEGEDD